MCENSLKKKKNKLFGESWTAMTRSSGWYCFNYEAVSYLLDLDKTWKGHLMGQNTLSSGDGWPTNLSVTHFWGVVSVQHFFLTAAQIFWRLVPTVRYCLRILAQWERYELHMGTVKKHVQLVRCSKHVRWNKGIYAPGELKPASSPFIAPYVSCLIKAE